MLFGPVLRSCLLVIHFQDTHDTEEVRNEEGKDIKQMTFLPFPSLGYYIPFICNLRNPQIGNVTKTNKNKMEIQIKR